MATTEQTQTPSGAWKWIAFVAALLLVYFLLRSCFDAPVRPVASDSAAVAPSEPTAGAAQEATPSHDAGGHDAAAVAPAAAAPAPAAPSTDNAAAAPRMSDPAATAPPPTDEARTRTPAGDPAAGAMGGKGPAGKPEATGKTTAPSASPADTGALGGEGPTGKK